MATAANDDSLADSTSMVANDGTVGPAGDAVQQQFREAMVLSLANKQYRNAIVALRQLRYVCFWGFRHFEFAFLKKVPFGYKFYGYLSIYFDCFYDFPPPQMQLFPLLFIGEKLFPL